MRIILSRKGFDTAYGRKPSPILPDGRMVSLPIPDRQSPIRYGDVRWQEDNLGTLVSELTGGRIPPSHFAHLDPDINEGSLPRQAGWKPLFGQTGAAQGHLLKNGVRTGDLFLFFGLFKDVVRRHRTLDWDAPSRRRHILWGWLQIEEILAIDSCDLSQYEWAMYHPHLQRKPDRNNTLYIARRHLSLSSVPPGVVAGAGVFPHFSERLVLTAPHATRPSLWQLPEWFYPRNGKVPLSYHLDAARWRRTSNGTELSAVARGQEFILNAEQFPEAIEWVGRLWTSEAVSH